MPSAPSATAFIRPYDYRHDRYSAYYREGLRRCISSRGGSYREVALGRRPRLLRAMRRIRDAYRLRPVFDRAPWLLPSIDRLAAALEADVLPPARVFVPTASHFVVVTSGGLEVRLCVDSDDEGDRIDEAMLAWSDVYLKTNYWPTLRYPPKVKPFVNADPLVIRQLRTLRSHRDAAKELDVCMVVRVWGGKDEEEGVEHNLRLIEAVARARGSKFLYAYLVTGDIAACARRLQRQGIPHGTDPVPGARLWQAMAASRLNVIRLGMHYCVPWRITGALAIGAGIVLDRAPLTRWPEPLTEGVNYVALGTETDRHRPLGTDAQYAAIPDQIDAWLAERELALRLGRANARYFDRFVDPEALGEQMLAVAEQHARSALGSRADQR